MAKRLALHLAPSQSTVNVVVTGGFGSPLTKRWEESHLEIAAGNIGHGGFLPA